MWIFAASLIIMISDTSMIQHFMDLKLQNCKWNKSSAEHATKPIAMCKVVLPLIKWKFIHIQVNALTFTRLTFTNYGYLQNSYIIETYENNWINLSKHRRTSTNWRNFPIYRSFKANRKLQKIHPNGFAGILNVMELYVFYFSIADYCF